MITESQSSGDGGILKDASRNNNLRGKQRLKDHCGANTRTMNNNVTALIAVYCNVLQPIHGPKLRH
jgi:hypothetical protein